MEFSSSILVFLTTILALAIGQATNTARVINNCTFTAYVQSVPNNNSGPPGPVIILRPNGQGSIYTEPLRANGSAIKCGTTTALKTPLTFGYTPSNGLVYYDLSDQSGNPFLPYNNTLITSISTCPQYNCTAKNETCYSDANHLRIYACNVTSLNLTLCA